LVSDRFSPRIARVSSFRATLNTLLGYAGQIRAHVHFLVGLGQVYVGRQEISPGCGTSWKVEAATAEEIFNKPAISPAPVRIRGHLDPSAFT
jgi:hypothetical protein